VNDHAVQLFFGRTAIEQFSKCWLWTGSKDKDGYGRLRFQKKTIRANRLSFRIFKGDIPQGKLVCHHCDNPQCVNPDHLYAGTPKQNSADRDRRGRANIAHGQRHYKAKLTDDEVFHIRSSGDPLRSLAKQYGQSASTISRLQLGVDRVDAGGPVRARIDTHRRTETHCANGHERSAKNRYINQKTGKEFCRKCCADSAKRARQRARP